MVELVKRLIQQCSEHLRSNEGLQSVLRKFEVVVVSISRKVISPVVQQVFRSKARSALAGFIGGLGRGTDAISMSPYLFWVAKVKQVSQMTSAKEVNLGLSEFLNLIKFFEHF